MELVLFLIAAGIIFYLYKTFQVYLSNPIIPNDKDTLHIQAKDVSQSIQVSPKDKLKATEYGIIVRILGKLSFADDKSCALEEKLISGIIHDMALESDKSEEEYLEIYRESANEDIEELANLFAAETIAQYKKRLKIIEFMFALSYADGNFTQEEEDMIISVAAILEIENDDFNKLYDEFKEILETKGGYIKMMWCGDEECEVKIKEETGATSRCIKEDEEAFGDICPICGRPAKKVVYFAKAY